MYPAFGHNEDEQHKFSVFGVAIFWQLDSSFSSFDVQKV